MKMKKKNKKQDWKQWLDDVQDEVGSLKDDRIIIIARMLLCLLAIKNSEKAISDDDLIDEVASRLDFMLDAKDLIERGLVEEFKENGVFKYRKPNES